MKDTSGNHKMKSTITVNEKEITNPILKSLIAFVTIIFSLILVLVIVFVVLPFAGVLTGLSIGVSGIIIIAAGLGILIYLIFKSLISKVLTFLIKK